MEHSSWSALYLRLQYGLAELPSDIHVSVLENLDYVLILLARVSKGINNELANMIVDFLDN